MTPHLAYEMARLGLTEDDVFTIARGFMITLEINNAELMERFR